MSVEYTPEERAFYDRLVRGYGSEQALRDGYVQCSDLKYSAYTPEYLEERLHDWIKDGVWQAQAMDITPFKVAK